MGLQRWFGDNYANIVRWSAIYDIISTGPFAVPFVVNLQMDNLRKVHNFLGLKGDFPEFEPFHYLFATIMGTIAVVWSVLRIIKPEARFGIADGIGKVFTSLWMFYYAYFGNATEVVYVFLVLEIPWCCIQIGISSVLFMVLSLLTFLLVGYLLWWAETHPKRQVKKIAPRRKAQ